MSNAAVPLNDVAADMRPLIAAFRQAGEISFQSVPLDVARENYKKSCAANGLSPIASVLANDHIVKVPGGTINVRQYRTEASGERPAILFLHGGGWVVGNCNTHDGICHALAAQTGATVFSVDYRLAPEHPFPTPLNDCSDALLWLIENATDLQIDLTRVAICGDSAGANLAAVLANTPHLRPQNQEFLAQALLYPVTDLSQKSQSYQKISSGFPLSAAGMEWFSNHYLPAGQDAADPLISPLHASEICSAPTFIVTCGLDPLCDEGLAYATRLSQSGAHLEHHHLPNHAHGIFTSAGKIATGQRLLTCLANFFQTTFAESPRHEP